MNAWEMPQVQALGEERLRLMQEAAKNAEGKAAWSVWIFFWNMAKNYLKGDRLRRRAEGFACGGGGKPARTGAEAADTADADDGNLK